MSGTRTHRALLVGNTRLQEDPEHLGPLAAPPNDVAELRDALTDGRRGLHQAEDVIVRVDRTRDDVLQAIGRFFRSAGPLDQLLLYYSGHAIADDLHRLHLCGSDTMAQFPVSTAISADVVARMMDASAAAAVVVLLDCRYSASLQSAAAPPVARLAGPRRYVLANGHSTPGPDGPTRSASALTEAVVAGLLAGRERWPGLGGPVSLDELWGSVADRLRAAGEPDPQRFFDGAADLPVARAPAPSPAEPAAPDVDGLAPGTDPVAAAAPQRDLAAAASFDAPDQPEPGLGGGGDASLLGDQPHGWEPTDAASGIAGQGDGEEPAGLADAGEAAAPAEREPRLAAGRAQRRSWMDTMLTAAQRREVMGWELEFEYVRQESPHAAALLQLCTFLDVRGVPVGLLAGVGDVLPPELTDITHEQRALNAAVAVLEEHGFVARSGEVLTVPRLVQFAVRSNLGPQGGREWAGRALCLVAKAFSPPGGNAAPPAWAHPTRLLVHAEAAATHAQALGSPIEELPSVLDTIGTYLWSVGKPRSARVWFERVLETSRQLYGPVDRNVANAMEKLAAVYREAGEVARADRLQHDALAMSSALDRGLVRPDGDEVEEAGPWPGRP